MEKILDVIENSIDIARTLMSYLGTGSEEFFSILDEMEECVERLKGLIAVPAEELPF